MRLKETQEHKKLLDKYCKDDDLFDLIDLTYLIYRRTETDLDFADYLRDMLAYHADPVNK